MPSGELSGLEWWGAAATVAGLPLTILGLLYATYQVRLSRLATSASLIFSFNDSFRERWAAFTSATDQETKSFQFAEVVNVLEAVATILADGVFHGRSKRLLKRFLDDVLALIDKNAWCVDEFQALIQKADTFDNLNAFIRTQSRWRWLR